MRFKIDENLPAELVDDLKRAGHDGETVFDEGLSGATDPGVLERVRSEEFVLLTMDKGMASIRAYPPEKYFGIVLIRPQTSGRGAVLTFVRRHLPSILNADIPGHLLVVKEHSIRVR